MDHEASQALAHLQQATARLLATAGGLTDAQVREASLLPGWTRGHVLTHIARNADGIGNLLRSARTGTPIPMYPSRQARDADIEAGSARPAAVLLTDLRTSAGTLESAIASFPDDAWQVTVSGTRGEFPVRHALAMRLSEVEVHHADLGLAYGPRDWPGGFSRAHLPHAAAVFAGREGVPACLLRPDGMDTLSIGPDTGQVTVAGPPGAMLAWLIGRGDGTGLTVDPPGTPPVLPAWA